ncbi:MAG: FRG domain-containing protein [Deltaproteobacteria bacterium]|nr:FRG domain-containing protein [Deltaproteobacteria bacterium]
MIKTVTELIDCIKRDLNTWDKRTKPWFRGESGDDQPLCPKIAFYKAHEENYLLQSFRRQAGGLTNVPGRQQLDLWLFLAQHYGVPTRLLDWTEGALLALYFAINRGNENPRIYMLNPHRINEISGSQNTFPNYPLSFHRGGSLYVALAWQNRVVDQGMKKLRDEIGLDIDIPLAFPATYQDHRMIAQRSCFTIHGTNLSPIQDILSKKSIAVSDCLFEYKIDANAKRDLLRDLSILGVSAATIFPDLDNLARDLKSNIETFTEGHSADAKSPAAD